MSAPSQSNALSRIGSTGVALGSAVLAGMAFLYYKYKRRNISEWDVRATDMALVHTHNPIRQIVDRLKLPDNVDPKQLISLSIGDPTVFGNMETDPSIIAAVVKALENRRNDGYGPATGVPEARAAIAKKYSTPEAPVTDKDVIITSGCSGALVIAIPTLAAAGENILIPKPGFSLYTTVCGHYSIDCKYYNLLKDKDWECDLKHMESLIDNKTRAILINNPSNPCGSNFSKEHLLDILALAEKYKLPIISDEIYGNLVFYKKPFYPLATLTSEVPILTVGGIAKEFVVPGWRLGWIVIHNKKGRLGEVPRGLMKMSQLILGANMIMQYGVPAMLFDTPPAFREGLVEKLETQATYCAERLKTIPGLRVNTPQGAMYMMVEIDVSQLKDIKDDVEFSQKLVTEELVVVLPGQCFMAPNTFRIVFCAPKPVLKDAFDRLEHFMAQHRR